MTVLPSQRLRDHAQAAMFEWDAIYKPSSKKFSTPLWGFTGHPLSVGWWCRRCPRLTISISSTSVPTTSDPTAPYSITPRCHVGSVPSLAAISHRNS